MATTSFIAPAPPVAENKNETNKLVDKNKGGTDVHRLENKNETDEFVDRNKSAGDVYRLCDHPLIDLLRFVSKTKTDDENGDDDDKVSLCPCRSCKPPSWITRFIEKYLLSAQASSSRLLASAATVCVNGNNLLSWNSNNNSSSVSLLDITTVVCAENIWLQQQQQQQHRSL